MKTLWWGVLAATVLVACGGGGGTATPACVPATSVRIQTFGDSTQELQGTELQSWMDGRFGKGVVSVSNYGVSGSSSTDFPAKLVESNAITVVNYGINDSRQPNANVDSYKSQLRKINPSVFETPNPTFDGYAPAMRDVAAELNRPVIDVSKAFRAQPGWSNQVPDKVHPTWSALLWIMYQVVGPALAEQVDSRICTAQLDAAGRTDGSAVRASTPNLIVWGVSNGDVASATVTFTNGGRQAASLSFSGVSAPYSISPSSCTVQPRGGRCTVTVSLANSGPLGGQGTQTLTATGGSNGPVSMLIWGMLTPPP